MSLWQSSVLLASQADAFCPLLIRVGSPLSSSVLQRPSLKQPILDRFLLDANTKKSVPLGHALASYVERLIMIDNTKVKLAKINAAAIQQAMKRFHNIRSRKSEFRERMTNVRKSIHTLRETYEVDEEHKKADH